MDHVEGLDRLGLGDGCRDLRLRVTSMTGKISVSRIDREAASKSGDWRGGFQKVKGLDTLALHTIYFPCPLLPLASISSLLRNQPAPL